MPIHNKLICFRTAKKQTRPIWFTENEKGNAVYVLITGEQEWFKGCRGNFFLKNLVFKLWFFTFWMIPSVGLAQTDVSLYMKKGSQEPLDFVESKSGNLFNKLGHHGPAIENPWYGLRIYFHKKAAIDVYSKGRSGMELREKQWYPTKKEQAEGWGADYYKVGSTVGLGGVKLWDEGRLIDLHPVTKRSARVINYGDSASMRMVSEGIPYRAGRVDVGVRVTVYSDNRKAKVEARSLSGEDVQFVTGINYFGNLEIRESDDYIATWGIHPEDVAAEKVQVGGALFFPEGSRYEVKKLEKQFILITDPCQKICFHITSASQLESKFQTMACFLDLLEELGKYKIE